MFKFKLNRQIRNIRLFRVLELIRVLYEDTEDRQTIYQLNSHWWNLLHPVNSV